MVKKKFEIFIYPLNYKAPVAPLKDASDDVLKKQSNEEVQPKVEKSKVAQAGHEGSIAVLTACIGCFIGILMTSFIFICCNPCQQLIKKQQKYFSNIVSIELVVIVIKAFYIFGKKHNNTLVI